MPVPRVAVRIPQSRAVVEQVPLVPTAQQSNDWLKKARASLDEKCFSEAEKCIACVLRDDPRNQDALLIRGVIALEQREFSQTAGNAQQILAGMSGRQRPRCCSAAMMWQHQTQQAIARFKQVVLSGTRLLACTLLSG